MIPYTISYTRKAIADIYTIPRGTVAEVTNAIRALGLDSRPFGAFEVELPNTFVMKIEQYFITYEIYDVTRTIIVLVVEEEIPPKK